MILLKDELDTWKYLINQDLICSAAYARVILRKDIGLSLHVERNKGLLSAVASILKDTAT